MLTVITGRAGSGKTTQLLQRLCAAGASRPQICLVPEQYSHEMERRLCQVGGDGTSMYAEVLSFTRLASRVFRHTGESGAPQLDQGGRILLMHRAVQAVQSALTVYARPSRHAAFLQQLLATSDELKSYCVRPEELTLAAGEDGDGDKLRDLSLILGTYQALVAQRAADPRDRLTRLAEALQQSDYLRGCDVYVDCFLDFTGQEMAVLKQILRQANSLTIALTCCDPEAKGYPRSFEPAMLTLHSLRALAAAQGVTCRVQHLAESRAPRIPALGHLERYYPQGNATWEEPTDAVTIFTGERPFDQVEFAAGKLLELVREKGWRWRDIAVTARSLEGWEEEIKSVFTRYGIPVSMNRMTDILQKPILSLITSALHAVTGDFAYSDVFRYLKTGLVAIDPDQRDLLENYALTWQIKGSKWTTDTPWTWHPEGYGQKFTTEAEERVAALDALRREVMAPLKNLKRSPGSTGADRARALYAFMEEIGLQTRLEEQAALLTERGDLTQAEEYCQLWDILCNALEQCVALLEQDPMDMNDFAQLFQLVLSQYEVGSIPVSLDRVTVGDAPRMSHRELKALLVLGADDTAFPQLAPSAGLLTDEERLRLRALDKALAPTVEDRTAYELNILYELVSLPREALVVCYSTANAGGESLRPSILVSRLEALFPQCTHLRTGGLLWEYRLTAPIPALEYLAEHRNPRLMEELKDFPPSAQGAARLERAFQVQPERLSSEGVDRLYTRTIRMSASKMDRLKSCHFAYFMEYGLHARARKVADLGALEFGNFIHYVLEKLLQTIQAGGGFGDVTEQTLRTMTTDLIARYIREELGGLEDKPPRFRYLFQRLEEDVHHIVRNVVEELRSSDFQPVAFELEFGRNKDIPWEVRTGNLTLSISGKVDRVDGWLHEGTLYYRVMDYKSGSKTFDFTDILHGLSLQMLIYLFALQQRGPQLFRAAETAPAGALYLPVHDVITSGDRDTSPEARQKEVDQVLRRSGLVLDDLQVIEAMERDIKTNKRFLPVSISSKTGDPTGSLATLEQLGQLEQHVSQILDEIGQEFAQGNVTPDPYCRSGKNICDNCDYASACHFEEGQRGHHRRYQPGIRAQEFWAQLAEKY